MMSRIGRTLLLMVALAGWVSAQLPQRLRDELNDKFPSTRQKAVKELGAMDPSPQVPASTLASALATALKDKEQDVRQAAAGFLGAGRPADIAVPALIRAFAAVEDECESVRRQLAAKGAGEKRPSTRGAWNALGMEAYAGTILSSLQDHWDERAASGVAKIVRGWNLERISGDTVRRACVLLCHWRTRPALDAVVDVLARAQAAPRPARASEDKAVLMVPVGPDDVTQIISALDAAATASGMEKPAGFNAKGPADWKALLIANAAKIPWKLAESRPASRPSTSSRPAREK